MVGCIIENRTRMATWRSWFNARRPNGNPGQRGGSPWRICVAGVCLARAHSPQSAPGMVPGGQSERHFVNDLKRQPTPSAFSTQVRTLLSGLLRQIKTLRPAMTSLWHERTSGTPRRGTVLRVAVCLALVCLFAAPGRCKVILLGCPGPDGNEEDQFFRLTPTGG